MKYTMQDKARILRTTTERCKDGELLSQSYMQL